VRGRGRHGSRKDQTDLRQGLQQARVTVAAPDHTRAHRLGHRPVSDLQGCEFRWSSVGVPRVLSTASVGFPRALALSLSLFLLAPSDSNSRNSQCQVVPVEMIRVPVLWRIKRQLRESITMSVSMSRCVEAIDTLPF